MDQKISLPAASGFAAEATDGRATNPVHDHAVQFYEDDAFLSTVVAEFLAAGFAAGEPIVVIATAAHRRSFMEKLEAFGVNARTARRDGQVRFLDARRTLSRFTRDGFPDRERFFAEIGDVIRTAQRGRAGLPVRAYGEMVDLLWKDGHTEGAIALECLWNELATRHRFSLLCAYSMSNFGHASDADAFHRICEAHRDVSPTERYSLLDDRHQLNEVTRLQQRARVLEAEVRHRESVEQRLREAVAAEQKARLEAERATDEAEAARAHAEQANRAKSDFLAIMSHELRTPLNAIGGYVDLMELGVHGPVTTQQREVLERVQRNQRVLLGHINQVLNYARVEAGTVTYDVTDVSVTDVVSATQALILPQLQAHGLRFEFASRSRNAAVRADPEKLQQVLLNLLTNAVKFTDRGGCIRIDVDTTPASIHIHVSDSGIGIPPEKLLTIFEPFVQIDSKYTRTREGVGLGLAISRDLVRGMSGNLAARSEEGVGSTFTITLPRGTTT